MDKKYNITWVELNDDYIAVNPASGDWLLMDRSSKQLIGEIENGSSISELFKEHPEISKKDILELINKINRYDFETVTSSRKNYDCKGCHQGKYPRLAVLNLTEKCNLKCTYCYVSAGEDQNEYMTPETAHRIIDEYLAMNPGEKINITMHGGEPFLNYSLMKDIIEYTKPYRDKIELTTQTNATLLNDERVKYLKENNVIIGISIDGTEKLHDQTRVFQSGKGSFGCVMKGIELLKKHEVDFGSITVLNGHNVDQVEEIVDFFVENNILNISFSPMQKIGRGHDDDSSHLNGEQIFFAYKKIMDKIIKYNSCETRENFLYERTISQLAKSIFGNIRDFMCMRAPCGSGRDILGFGIHGDFYMCDDFINDDDFKIGNVYNGSIKNQLLQSRLLKKENERSMEKIPRCKDCIWRNICGGICHSSDHYSGANGEKETEMCVFYKSMIPYMIEKYAENPELPGLLAPDLKYAHKRNIVLIINRNDNEECIDYDSFIALTKVHNIRKCDNVYLCFDKIEDYDNALKMFKKINSRLAFSNIVIKADNAGVSEICEKLLAEELVDNVLVQIDDCSEATLNNAVFCIKEFCDYRNKHKLAYNIDLNISFENLIHSSKAFNEFLILLNENDRIYISEQELSSEDTIRLSDFIAGIADKKIKAKFCIRSLDYDRFKDNDLLYLNIISPKPAIYIDSTNFIGITHEKMKFDFFMNI